MAHDMRTPLQVMSMTAAMMARSADAASQAHAQRITGATRLASRLVEELMTSHAADDAQPPRRAPINVPLLLRDAVETMSVVATRHEIGLGVGDAPDVEVWADHAQVLRALCNLIGNSLKYCPAGSSALLSATADANAVKLSVSDDGPGMHPDEQPRAFERGWQGASGIALQQGTGLGLAIVRSIVEQNGGAVWLTSQPNAGTTVTMELPRR